MKKNEVRVHKIREWDDFVKLVRQPVPITGGWFGEGEGVMSLAAIYRGHSDSRYPLSSTMERNALRRHGFDSETGAPVSIKSINGGRDYRDRCEFVLESFRKHTKGMDQVDSMADAELWAYGRHFGLLSPYLDWTSSAFVAAFFAFAEIYQDYQHQMPRYAQPAGNPEPCVWGLRWSPELDASNELEISEIVGPFVSRQRAQQGIFTRLNSPDHTDVESYLADQGLAHLLECYEFSRSIAATALADLLNMNISYLTLFPDIHGAALHSNYNRMAIRMLSAINEHGPVASRSSE